MAELDHSDVAIIGSGAGGCALAWTPASSGTHLPLLEPGPYLGRPTTFAG